MGDIIEFKKTAKKGRKPDAPKKMATMSLAEFHGKLVKAREPQEADGDMRYRLWRRHKGLTLTQAAAACGKASAWLQSVERGDRKLSLEGAKLLAGVYSISLDDLLLGAPPKESSAG